MTDNMTRPDALRGRRRSEGGNPPRRSPGPALLLGLLAALLLSACVSYSTPADFDRALERARGGDAANVVRELRERFDQMSDQNKLQAIRILEQIKDPAAPAFLKEIVGAGRHSPTIRQSALGAVITRDEPQTPEFVRDAVTAHAPLLSEATANYLVDKQPEGAAQVLHAAFKGRTKETTQKVLQFWGTKAYTAAIPELKEAVESAHHSQTALEALIAMKHPDADAYLFAAAGNRDNPARAAALRLVLTERAGSHPKETGALVHGVLLKADEEPEATALLAIDLAPQLEDSEQTKEGLKRIYRESTKEELRTRALASLAKLEKTSPYILTREMQVSLIALQMGMAHWSLDAPASARKEGPTTAGVKGPPRRVARRETVEEPKTSEARDPIRPRSTTGPKNERASGRTEARRRSTGTARSSRRAGRAGTGPNDPREDSGRIPRKANYPRSSDAYRTRFHSFLREVLPEEDARAVYGKVSNALRVYGSSQSASARFVRRAYTREYGTSDDAALARLLAQGVSHPGSVHAVLLGIYQEYPNDALRAYALAQLFGLPRWQAAALLDFVRR